ncbi:MAG: chalcone isomerase family protein [Halioglobus sp.]
MKSTVISILLLTCAASAMSTEDSLKLVGEARLKVLLWSVYDSRLYSKTGNYNPELRPLRFEIEYLRNIQASDLVLQTELEWEQQGVDHPRRAQWLETLLKIWPDVAEDDVLTLHLDEQGESTFYSNDVLLGKIGDPDFGVHFLDIWLSPATSRPGLREGLLGQF